MKLRLCCPKEPKSSLPGVGWEPEPQDNEKRQKTYIFTALVLHESQKKASQPRPRAVGHKPLIRLILPNWEARGRSPVLLARLKNSKPNTAPSPALSTFTWWTWQSLGVRMSDIWGRSLQENVLKRCGECKTKCHNSHSNDL